MPVKFNCNSCGKEIKIPDELYHKYKGQMIRCSHCVNETLVPASEPLHQFPKQSTWGVIGLSIVTLTVYFPFWLRKHSRVINRILADNQIGNWWFPVCLCITILNFGMIIPEIITDNNPAVVVISNLMNKIDLILTIVWIFKVRNRMNIILKSEPKTPYWYHASWTLFFGIFYLQYKVNTLQDLEGYTVEQDAAADADKPHR